MKELLGGKGGNLHHSVVNCIDCGKHFISDKFLESHRNRRHPNLQSRNRNHIMEENQEEKTKKEEEASASEVSPKS